MSKIIINKNNNIMENKTLDLSKSVYDLVQQAPEVADIMVELGFSEITKKAMLHSVGRMMTLPKGSEMKGIPMDKIADAFRQHGFDLTGLSGISRDSGNSVISEKTISYVTR